MKNTLLIPRRQRIHHVHARSRGRWGQGVRNPPEKSQNILFPSNTGPDPLTNTKLPSQNLMFDHHRHASETPLNGVLLAADDDPIRVVFGSSLPSSLKKKKKKKRCQSWTPSGKISGSAHDVDHYGQGSEFGSTYLQ